MSPFERRRHDPERLVALERVWPEWARRDPVKTVVSVHDLAPLVLRYRHPAHAAEYESRRELMRSADVVLASTDATAADVERLLGVEESRIMVVGVGAPAEAAALIGSATGGRELLRMSFPAVRDGFLLYVGGEEPNENLDAMLAAYARFPRKVRSRHQLVVVGGLDPRRIRGALARARNAGVKVGELLGRPQQQLLLGDVPDHFRGAMLRSCALFVRPTLNEGAGLPLLEAMACGAAVAASNTGSAPEILGDERAAFDPTDPDSIADRLERTLADPEELESLRERSRRRVAEFTWERVAERTVEGYERALGGGVRSAMRRLRHAVRIPAPRIPAPQRRGPAPGRARPRLAILTPWTPQPTGVATHSRRLVEQLTAYADVDVIVEEEREDYDRSLAPAVELHTAADLERLREVRGYDRVIHALGNSEFHVFAYEALMSSPGTVLAHDVRLTQLYGAAATSMNSSGPDWMLAKLRKMYGDRVPREELERIPDVVTENKYSILMSGEVQERADEILVHSRHALEAMKMEPGAEQLSAPAEIVPHGIPEPLSIASGAPNRDAPVLVSCGHFGLVKGLDAMLNAFALVASERPGARLRLVGQLGDYDREYMEMLSSGLGVADSVELHGRVDQAEYWRLLSSADVAVQLRFWSNGEASGAVADCLAARVPTIVSDIGWFSELPDRVALRVPPFCDAERLAREMLRAVDDQELRSEVAAALEGYVAENSYAEVAKRYAQVLALS
jgi:glycosyltransferase involved in cell wall biosynthesis